MLNRICTRSCGVSWTYLFVIHGQACETSDWVLQKFHSFVTIPLILIGVFKYFNISIQILETFTEFCNNFGWNFRVFGNDPSHPYPTAPVWYFICFSRYVLKAFLISTLFNHLKSFKMPLCLAVVTQLGEKSVAHAVARKAIVHGDKDALIEIEQSIDWDSVATKMMKTKRSCIFGWLVLMLFFFTVITKFFESAINACEEIFPTCFW